MSSSQSSAEGKRTRIKYTLDDPRSRPSSASPATQATFLRRLGLVRRSQPAISRPGRIARASRIISNVTIPFVLVYAIFLVDWGPNDHVFSGPQRWLRRQKEAFWSLPPEDNGPINES